MYKLLIIMLICLATTQVYGIEPEVSLYKENYALFAGKHQDNNLLITQFSFTLKLLDITVDIEKLKGDFYFGYTNKFWMDIWGNSNPIIETNYLPEVFYKSDPIAFDNMYFKCLEMDYYKLGLAHHSNGKNNNVSRSLNFGYFEAEKSYGNYINIGINVLIKCYFWVSDDNTNYEKYTGIGNYELFVRLRDMDNRNKFNEKLSYKCNIYTGRNIRTKRQEITITLRMFTLKFNPMFYIKYEEGCGLGGLIEFDEDDKYIKAGVIFE